VLSQPRVVVASGAVAGRGWSARDALVHARANPLDAAAYHHELRTFFVPRGLVRDGYPRFDLVVLGLDAREEADGLPARTVEGGRWAVATFEAESKRYEIGLTLAVLNNARKVFFLALARGVEKAHVLRAVLDDADDDGAGFTRRVRPLRGTVRWLVDAEAGSLLRFDS